MMIIKRHILAGVSLSIVVSAVILYLVFSVSRDNEKELARGRVYGEIKNTIDSLNVAVARAPSQHNRSRIRQILSMRESVEKHLEALSPRDLRETTLLRQIRTNTGELAYTLDKLTSDQSSGLDAADDADRYNVLFSQLWMKTQFISDDTHLLLRISQSRIDAAQKKASYLTYGLIVALVLFNAAISFFFGRSVVHQQQRLQRALAKAEDGDRMLSALMEYVPEGITIADASLRISHVSRYGRELLGGVQEGRSVGEVAGQWQVHAADGRTVMASDELPLARAVQRGEIVENVELFQVNASGRSLPLLCTAGPIRDNDGKVIGGIVTWRDVTDRRRAEDALRRSEARWNAAIENFAEGAILATEDEQLIYWNPAARAMHGMASDGEGIGPLAETPRTFQLSTVDRGHLLALDEWPMRRIRRGETVRGLELRLHRPDQGWEKIVSYSGTMIETSSGERLIFLSVYDLTDQRQAEAALRLSEERFAKAFASNPSSICLTKMADSRIIDANPAFTRIFGYSPEEFTGRTILDLGLWPTQQDREAAVAELRRHGFFHNRPQTMLTKAGEAREFLSSAEAITIGDEPMIVSTWLDITEFKRTADALAASERKYRELVETANSIIIRWDDRGVIRFINDFGLAFFGYGAGEILDRDGAGIANDATGPERVFDRLFRDIVSHPEQYAYLPNEHLTKDGRAVSVAWTNRVIRDHHGQVIEVLAIGNDITTLKEKEEALRASDQRFRLALRNAPISVAAQDRDLRFIWAYNQRTARPEEIVCRFDHDLFIPEEAAHITAGKQRVLRENIELREQMWITRPSQRIFLDVCYEPMLDEAGNVVGVATATVDLTPLKLAEEALQASLAEKEVLLKEIHHRVKNNMQVISSLVDLQADEVEDPAMRAILQDVIYRVRSMAMVHEKLYKSADLANVEFADYAQGLLGYLWRAQGAAAGRIEMRLDLQPVYLPVNAAVPCGLILSELFSNALKHAFLGRDSGMVTVSLGEDSRGEVRLNVRDNGIGLPPGWDWQQSRALGLRIVRTLARQLQAAVEVVSDNGTQFTILFDKKRK